MDTKNPRTVEIPKSITAKETSWTPDGEPEGNLMLWIEDGRLAGPEHAAVADEHPSDLRDVGRIREPLLGG